MRILMVCLGNICRSPLADGVMQDKIEKYNLSASVDSAGTSAYHIGEAPDSRSQKNALSHNIDLSNLRARQFVKSDFDNFDLIFAMDESNYRNILKLANSDSDRAKVKMLLNESHPNSNMEVPDPYFGGDQGFENVFQLIDEACEAIVKNHFS